MCGLEYGREQGVEFESVSGASLSPGRLLGAAATGRLLADASDERFPLNSDTLPSEGHLDS